MKMKKLIAFSICVITLVLLTVTSVAAAEIFVSSSGSDANNGLSSSTAVATFDKAYALIGNNDGTIKVLDNMTYSAGAAHTGVVTIKGNTASVKLTLPSEVSLNGPTTFETLTLSGESTIYANGHPLTVQSDVTSDSLLTVYGAKKDAWFSGTTSVKLYGGQYKKIFGGGNYQGASGSDIVLGGNANPNDKATDNGTCQVFGGANHQYVSHTKVTLEGNAIAKYVFGSGDWGGSQTTQVYIKGGQAMNVYGGSNANQLGNDTTNASATIEMTGGKVESIFGGNSVNVSNSTAYGLFTGKTVVSITGGEVTRRVYTGSYNDASGLFSLSYSSDLYIKGSTSLIIGPDAKLVTNVQANSGIFAGSRTASQHDDEINTVIFLDGCSLTLGERGSSYVNYLKSHHDYIVKASANGTVVPADAAGTIKIVPATNYVGRIGTKAYKADSTYTLSQAQTEVDFVKPVVEENGTITVNVDDQTIDLKKYASYEKHGDGYFFNGWKVNGAYVALGEDRIYEAKAGDVLTPVSTAVSLEETGDMYVLGAQIREAANGKYDLRFVTQFSRDFLATDVIGITTYGGENVQYGHIVLPKEDKFVGMKIVGEIVPNDKTGDNDVVFVEKEELLELDKPTLTGYIPRNVPAVKLFEEPSDDYIKFTVCITNIATRNYDRNYIVRPYVKYTDGNGVERVIYGEQYSAASVNSTLAEQAKANI